MGTIIYNGISTKDVGIIVETFPDREYPEREIDFVHVPGRDGDIAQDLGSYKNVTRTYNIAILADDEHPFQYIAAKISKWLHSGIGYCRLEDSYEPEVYRMAAYVEGSNVTSLLRQAGRATINFNCKPQRYLKSGESSMFAYGNYTLENPTDQYAKPLIKINTGSGEGTVTINDIVITLGSDLNGEIYIDCEEQVCYRYSGGSIVSCDNSVSLSADTFPSLKPGINTTSYTSPVVSLEITPRWYII